MQPGRRVDWRQCQRTGIWKRQRQPCRKFDGWPGQRERTGVRQRQRQRVWRCLGSFHSSGIAPSLTIAFSPLLSDCFEARLHRARGQMIDMSIVQAHNWRLIASKMLSLAAAWIRRSLKVQIVVLSGIWPLTRSPAKH
jgi:hypothetical protein